MLLFKQLPSNKNTAFKPLFDLPKNNLLTGNNKFQVFVPVMNGIITTDMVSQGLVSR